MGCAHGIPSDLRCRQGRGTGTGTGRVISLIGITEYCQNSIKNDNNGYNRHDAYNSNIIMYLINNSIFLNSISSIKDSIFKKKIAIVVKKAI